MRPQPSRALRRPRPPDLRRARQPAWTMINGPKNSFGLAPVRRGEGKGEGSVPSNAPSPNPLPGDRGEGEEESHSKLP
jgi:hypothetical protein